MRHSIPGPPDYATRHDRVEVLVWEHVLPDGGRRWYFKTRKWNSLDSCMVSDNFREGMDGRLHEAKSLSRCLARAIQFVEMRKEELRNQGVMRYEEI